jgi:hypothetical protein
LKVAGLRRKHEVRIRSVGIAIFRGHLQATGIDVMITFFCDFCQFSAKKLAFFSKTNVMIKILPYLALF